MTPERYQKVNHLFHAALERSPNNRAAYLEDVCGSDEALRRDVERLLASHEEAGSFLNQPVAAAELLEKEAISPLIGRELGHYRIISLLGVGGMGEVFLAKDVKLERRVALKILPAAYTQDPDLVGRFEREARAASALNHPNIITIHEISQIDGVHFIASEFIEGETLRDRIARGPLPLVEAAEIAIQVSSALAAAHNAGIIHRDVKPENVMIRPDGYIKVLDFGLAKLTPMAFLGQETDLEAETKFRQETRSGIVLGTPAYMSPEQARGLRVDYRTDIWSAGVMLYEMAIGGRPFTGQTSTDVLVSILERQPQPLSERLPQAPSEIDQIVTKALAKDLSDRYQSAAELTADLKTLKRGLELNDLDLPDTARLTSRQPGVSPETADLKQTKRQAPAQITTANLPSLPASMEPGASSKRPLFLALALLIVAGGGLAAWIASRPKPASPSTPVTVVNLPERRFNYSITVQKMRDGKPYQGLYQATGRDIYENGYKFRINFISPQTGYLYLLNEGPSANGGVSYVMVFPIPSTNRGSAQLAANQDIQTGWYLFDESPGTEKFWMVWAAQPVSELEAVKSVVNPTDKGLISHPVQINAVRNLLSKNSSSQSSIEIDKVKKQTVVAGRGDVLVNLAELEHR